MPWKLRAGVAMLDADVVGLQEIDVRVCRSWFVDQLRLARRAASASAAVFGFARWFGPGGRYGNGLVVRGAIANHEVIDLPVSGSRERRVAISADVAVGGHELTVVVTHLQNFHAEALLQLEFLVARLSTVRGPVVLLGDLNMHPDDVRAIVEPAGFTVAGGANSSGVDHPYQRIDHVVARGLTFDAIDVPRPPVSDHRPVIATMRVER